MSTLYVNLSDGYTSYDVTDTSLGANPKVVLAPQMTATRPDRMTMTELKDAANGVRVTYLTERSSQFISETAIGVGERRFFSEMKSDLQDRRPTADSRGRATIDAILVDIKSWQDWIATVMQEMFVKIDVVNGRITLTDAYEPIAMDEAALTASKPAVATGVVCRDYITYITS